MVYSVVRLEEATSLDRRDADQGSDWLELIRKTPDLRFEQAGDMRPSSNREEDDKLFACIDLIYEDLGLTDATN